MPDPAPFTLDPTGADLPQWLAEMACDDAAIEAARRESEPTE